MPYIPKISREAIDKGIFDAGSAGELNYQITKLLVSYWKNNGETGYQHINDIIGALEGAKLEFIRRVVNPYEQEALDRNGDIY